MHTLKIDKTAYTLPSSWDETTDQQRVDLLPLRMLDIEKAAVASIRALLPRRALLKLNKADGVQITAISELFTWVADEIPAGEEVEPLIKSFKYDRKRYYLPLTSLADVTIDEFTYIEYYIDQIKSDTANVEQHARELIATVCRPLRPKRERNHRDYDGYPRIHFNPEHIETRAKDFQKVPAYVLMAVFEFLQKCKQMIAERYWEVFQGDGGDDGLGWQGMQLSLAQSGVFGSAEQVKKVNIHDALLYSLKRVRERKEEERRLKKQRKRR